MPQSTKNLKLLEDDLSILMLGSSVSSIYLVGSSIKIQHYRIAVARSQSHSPYHVVVRTSPTFPKPWDIKSYGPTLHLCILTKLDDYFMSFSNMRTLYHENKYQILVFNIMWLAVVSKIASCHLLQYKFLQWEWKFIFFLCLGIQFV